MGIFNRSSLRKRSFLATIIEAGVVNDWHYPKGDLPAQAAIVLTLKTTAGKEFPKEYPIGDAVNFKVILDGKGVRPKGDVAIGEQSGGGILIAALDKCGVPLDDSVEPLEGLTFRWGQEAVPGKTFMPLIPIELMSQKLEEEEADDEPEEDEDTEDEETSEEDEDTEEEHEDADPDALATKAILAILKARKKVSVGRIGVEVHKCQALTGVSNKDRVAAAKLAGTSKFLKAKGQPWVLKGDSVVKA